MLEQNGDVVKETQFDLQEVLDFLSVELRNAIKPNCLYEICTRGRESKKHDQRACPDAEYLSAHACSPRRRELPEKYEAVAAAKTAYGQREES